MQFTDLLIIHFSFFFLCFSFHLKPACFIGHENPPNKCAKMTRQNNPPKWSARKVCHGNLLDSPAIKIRRIYSPDWPAISTRGLLARDPPFPAQNPQARPGPPSLPPSPQQLRQRSRGRGQGAGPAHPRILNRYFYFHSPFHEWLHILIWHDTDIFHTERINMKV